MMGVVYRALDPALGRSVALKTVGLAFAVAEDERASFEQRFMAEARVAAGLSHPGIVVVHDVGRDAASGMLYIALELLSGRTLADMVAGGAPLAPAEALRITARVAEALHHAHAKGIVHRDIKPANIMMLPSGAPKIMDFGIAKVPTAQLTAAGQFFGTPSYMSPEQASGLEIDGRSDLFSLGAVLYVLLTGRRAFDAPTIPSILTQVVMEDPPPPSRFVAGLPPGVDEVVTRSLAKQPGGRYEDCAAFARDLEAVRAWRPPGEGAALAGNVQAAGLESLLGPVAEPPTVAMRPGTVPPAAGLSPPAAAPPAAGLSTAAGRPPAPVLPAAAGLPSTAGLPPVASLPAAAGLPSTTDHPHAAPEQWKRRGLLAAAALLLAGLGAALFAPRGQRPAIVPLVEPSRLEIDFEHSLKSGTLKVWLDDELVLEEPLESRVTRKVLALRFRKGRTEKDLEVSPGEHVVRVEVSGDGFHDSRRIRGDFDSGVTRHLRARVGGLLNRELSLVWGASEAAGARSEP